MSPEVECELCFSKLPPGDVEFIERWHEFSNFEFLEQELCSKCFQELFSARFPSYSPTDSPFVLYLRSLLCERLGQTPSHRSDSELRVLIDKYVMVRSGENLTSALDLCEWLESAIPVSQIHAWIKSDYEVYEADFWHLLGVKREDVEGWIQWDVYPGDLESLRAEYGYRPSKAPDFSLGAYGHSIEEILALLSSGFSAHSDEPPKGLLPWLKLKLRAVELINLRNQIKAEFRQRGGRKVLVGEFGDHFDWSRIMVGLEGLKGSGLPLSVENVKRFAGMSVEQILAAIDSAVEISFAVKAARLGATAEQISAAFHIRRLGCSVEEAVFLVKRGASFNALDSLLKLNFPVNKVSRVLQLSPFIELSDVTKWVESDVDPTFAYFLIQGSCSQDSIERWCKGGRSLSEASPWVKAKFSLDDALPHAIAGLLPSDLLEIPDVADNYLSWQDAGFEKSEADAWIKMGVDDPTIARRRHLAGIQPSDSLTD